jgi:hypothetical protein
MLSNISDATKHFKAQCCRILVFNRRDSDDCGSLPTLETQVLPQTAMQAETVSDDELR